MPRRSSPAAAAATAAKDSTSPEASRGTRRPREDDDEGAHANSKRRPWTQAEDEMVIHIVSVTDGKRWAEADLLPPGRTAKQCRERYHNHLDPRMNRKEPWSEQEDRIPPKGMDVLRVREVCHSGSRGRAALCVAPTRRRTARPCRRGRSVRRWCA